LQEIHSDIGGVKPGKPLAVPVGRCASFNGSWAEPQRAVINSSPAETPAGRRGRQDARYFCGNNISSRGNYVPLRAPSSRPRGCSRKNSTETETNNKAKKAEAALDSASCGCAKSSREERDFRECQDMSDI